MPRRIQKPCRLKSCSTLTRNKNGYCDEHASHASGWKRTQDKKGTPEERGYGTEWKKLRKVILERDAGLCQVCFSRGMIKLAKEVDHIIPKSSGGNDDPSNLQSICKVCHRVKTAFDSAGSRRGMKAVKLFPDWIGQAMCDLTIVFGPSGSGKSTYVSERAEPSDLVIDLDHIVCQISGSPIYQAESDWIPSAIYCRNELLGMLGHEGMVRKAWFVVTGRTPEQRRWWIEKLNPRETVTLFPGQDECIRRLKADERRKGVRSMQIKSVFDWVPD